MQPAITQPAPRVQVPSRAQVLQTLGRVPYDDAFAADAPGAAEHRARAWARAVFEESHPWFRAFLVGTWRAFQVRLGPLRSDRHVLGWEILDESDDAIVLGAHSALGVRLQLVVVIDAARVAMATFVTFDRVTGRAAFLAIAPAHRATVAYLVARAAHARPRRAG